MDVLILTQNNILSKFVGFWQNWIMHIHLNPYKNSIARENKNRDN